MDDSSTDAPEFVYKPALELTRLDWPAILAAAAGTFEAVKRLEQLRRNGHHGGAAIFDAQRALRTLREITAEYRAPGRYSGYQGFGELPEAWIEIRQITAAEGITDEWMLSIRDKLELIVDAIQRAMKDLPAQAAKVGSQDAVRASFEAAVKSGDHSAGYGDEAFEAAVTEEGRRQAQAELQAVSEALPSPPAVLVQGADSPLIPVDRADLAILAVLAENPGVAMKQADIIEAMPLMLRLSERTLGPRLGRLRNEGLTARPLGNRGGDAITARGIERLNASR